MNDSFPFYKMSDCEIRSHDICIMKSFLHYQGIYNFLTLIFQLERGKPKFSGGKKHIAGEFT